MNQTITPPHTPSDGVSNDRQSNFEALRLLCMIMVLNLHSFHGWQNGCGVWQAIDFLRESSSICAVDCFILISGYFGIKWKFKSFFNLVFQVFFYSVGIYLFAVAFGIVAWDVKSLLVRFTCLSANSWGFVVSYIILYFCSPLLNAFAEKLTVRELFVYCIVFILALNIVSFTAGSAFTYAVVYLIGRLLRKVNISDQKVHAGRCYWVMTLVIFILVYVVLFKIAHIHNGDIIGKRPLGSIGYDYASPLVILQAVALFSVFAKWKFKSKIINWCASSAFAIFLIHMHPSIKQIGYLSFTQSLYELPVLKHISLLLLLITVVFTGSILIDKLRIGVSNACYAFISVILRHIPRKYTKIDTYLPKSITEYI